MNDVKWIKLTTDMFDNRKIKAIRKLPEGNNIILIWVMLLSLAGRCNASGMIFLTENIPYTNKMLADELDFEESIIYIAIDTLEKFGMISRDDNLFISVNNWAEYQSVDGMDKIREQTRKRVRNFREREKQKQLNCNKARNTTLADSSISYSFSPSKSNIHNLNYLLDTYSEDYKYITDNKELLEAVTDWMEYKDQKKPKGQNHYDSERGMKGFLNKVTYQSIKYGKESVIEIINDSISNNYQGVTWDRLENKKYDIKRKTEKSKDYIQEFIDSGGDVDFTGF